MNSLPDAIELLIKDDGQGFEPASVSGTQHLGLTSMRERVAQFHGTLTIRSKRNEGTTLAVTIPLTAHNAHKNDLMPTSCRPRSVSLS